MPIIRSSRLYLCYCRIWCVMPWLLVVGCYKQSSRLCVRDEGDCRSLPQPGRIACCCACNRLSHNLPHPGRIACCSACNRLSHNLPHPGRIACCSACNSRPPATKALHIICGNNTSIVSNSWWWAYKYPKHVEQIISAIKYSVASSWVPSLCLYYDACTNIHQIHWIIVGWKWLCVLPTLYVLDFNTY